MKTVDITTTQNVTIEYELASVGERIGAFIIDFMIMCALSWILAICYAATEGNKTLMILVTILFTIVLSGYTFWSETLLDGQTIGKRALNIKVVQLNGEVPETSVHFTRWAFRLLDIYTSFGSLAFTLISSNRQAQRFGDLAANTVVIKMRSSFQFTLQDILNISVIDNYTPQFQDVRRLSEKDMLLIKNTLVRTEKYSNAAHNDARNELVKRVAAILEIPYGNIRNHELFLKTLLKDYIVLTR